MVPLICSVLFVYYLQKEQCNLPQPQNLTSPQYGSVRGLFPTGEPIPFSCKRNGLSSNPKIYNDIVFDKTGFINLFFSVSHQTQSNMEKHKDMKTPRISLHDKNVSKSSPVPRKRPSKANPVSPEDQKSKKQKKDHSPNKKGHEGEKQNTVNKYFSGLQLLRQKYLKNVDNIPFVDLLKDPPLSVYVKDFAGGIITGLYADKLGMLEEGNIYCLLRGLGVVDASPLTPYDKMELEFRRTSGLVAACPRRASKSENKALLKKSPNSPAMYKQTVFLAFLKANGGQSKLALLGSVVKVSYFLLIRFIQKLRFSFFVLKFLKAHGVNAEIKPAFDQTNPDVQALDNYIPDDCCVRVVQKFFKSPTDRSFYTKNPEICDLIFSEPYPEIAQRELGYPAKKESVSGLDLLTSDIDVFMKCEEPEVLSIPDSSDDDEENQK